MHFTSNIFRLVPESLRWMILQKRIDQVEELVQKVTKVNKLPYPQDTMATIRDQAEASGEGKVTQYSFIDLLRTAGLRRLSLILFYLW